MRDRTEVILDLKRIISVYEIRDCLDSPSSQSDEKK